MGFRSRFLLFALLLAFGSCSYHHFSKSRFLKECDIHPDQMTLSPQKEKEEVAAGHFHSAGGQALLDRFQSKHKMSDCQELLRGYGQGFFLWEYGRGADSLLADHLLSWGIRHSQKTEDVINYALKYAFCQPTERKIAITRVCSDYLELVSDSLAYQILYNLSEALNRPKDVDYQEAFSVEQKRLKYTMSLYGTESDIFLNNLSDCAHTALYADHPEWPMWADSLYRYHKDRAIHYWIY